MNTRLFDLKGRVALVTGSSQGLGFTIARGLGEAGATLSRWRNPGGPLALLSLLAGLRSYRFLSRLTAHLTIIRGRDPSHISRPGRCDGCPPLPGRARDRPGTQPTLGLRPVGWVPAPWSRLTIGGKQTDIEAFPATPIC